MTMPSRRQFVLKCAAVLMTFGLIAGRLPGFAAAPAGPEWSWGLPVYQIATRYYNETGGFKEIEKDIPRLKSLHVGIIYLMPVHPCSDDLSRDAQMRGNNYQTADFQGVNPAMGALQDYKDLVKALHANGMYAIQDMVPRHMHPGNNMLKLHPDWAKGKSWGLPAWNYDNPHARQYMLDSLKYWIREVDIDGYRIDVAGSDPLPEVFQEFIPELRKIKPIFMLAEADGPRFHPLYDMTYDWRNAKTMIVEIVQKGGPASLIDENIRRDLSEYPAGALRMRHLDNHDFNVGMAPWGKIFGNMDERYGGGQKAFAVLAATLPGKWMFFMGNEINNPRRIPHAWGKDYDWLRWPPEASNASEFTDLYTKLTDTDDPMKDHAYTRVLPGWVSGQNASGVVTWNAEGNFKNRVNDPEIPDIPGRWTGARITLLIYNNTFGTPEGGTPEQPLRMMGANTCQLNLTQYKDAPQSINNNIYMNRQFENAMALRASELAIGREKLDPSTVFVDPTGRSGGLGFQLKAGSPAINRGVPVNGTMDATGKPIDYVDNFDGPAPDCGAYEFGKEPWVPGCNLSKEFIEGQPWERQWSPKRIQ